MKSLQMHLLQTQTLRMHCRGGRVLLPENEAAGLDVDAGFGSHLHSVGPQFWGRGAGSVTLRVCLFMESPLIGCGGALLPAAGTPGL